MFINLTEFLLQSLNFVVSFLMVTILFAMIYKIMPRANIAWRDVWIGAVVTSLLFQISANDSVRTLPAETGR